jgi:hypothetical protein
MNIASSPVPTMCTRNVVGAGATSMTVPVLSELTEDAQVTEDVPTPVSPCPGEGSAHSFP